MAHPPVKAMSLHNLAGPGTFFPDIQASLLLTFPTPTEHESVFWYTGRMNDAGDLLRLKIHAHNTLFAEALFFAASPEDLGLTESNGFDRSLPYKPDARAHEDVKKMLLDNLLKAQNEHKEDDSPQDGPCGYPHRSCQSFKPMLVCQFIGSLKEIDGFAFDRRQPTCCEPWNFKSGQPFTVVGFNRHMGYPQGPHNPDMSKIPSTLPGHVGFWLSYNAEGDNDKEAELESNWGYALYNHYEDGGLESVKEMRSYQKIAMLLNHYTSPHWNNPQYVPRAYASKVVAFGLENLSMFLVLFAVLFFYSIFRCLRCLHGLRGLRRRYNSNKQLELLGGGGGNETGHGGGLSVEQEAKIPFLVTGGQGAVSGEDEMYGNYTGKDA